MTAWWMRTTRVRKVRARSSAALRVVTFGAARLSAGAAEWEIDVMRAAARLQARCCRREPDSARPNCQPAKYRCDPAMPGARETVACRTTIRRVCPQEWAIVGHV